MIRKTLLIFSLCISLFCAGWDFPYESLFEYFFSLPIDQQKIFMGIAAALGGLTIALILRETVCLLIRTSQILDKLEEISKKLTNEEIEN